ncbi:hypothetical protein F1559_004692 [Cyanidiococcus yangmingshanensis]|uniref:GP-PDE domain-containing protein n=1 Tax=Cyanidiococcus yangmingshanensis TaxID=2690220 RepID=A0A7J7IPZ2_9RHOD|nr:hypothetical protein F1559_004692 [Cyanidiococcus yangmingshanensis]
MIWICSWTCSGGRPSADPVGATEDEPGRFIGRAAILASEMSELKGLLRRPLVNSAHIVIGEFVCEYCVIKPYAGELPTKLSHLRFDLVGSAKDQRRVQLVGHRGAGSQKTRSRVQENTVLSFLTAIRKGAVDAIELDVQLTRDQVPVIYHDFFIRRSEDDVDESDDERFQVAGSAALRKQNQRTHLPISSDDSSSIHAATRSSELNVPLERPHGGVADAANEGCGGESQHSPENGRAIVDERGSGIVDQRAVKNPSRFLESGAQSLAQRFRNDDSGKSRKWREHGIPIYSMTYEQFKSACGSLPRSFSRSGGLCFTHSCRLKEQRLSDDFLDFTRAASSADNRGYLERHFSDTGVSNHDSNPVAMIRDNALPSLRRVLDRVPEEITLLIEIKYPMPEFMRETSLPYPERNQFIDRILEVIFQKSSLQRRIVFLSFDPDVCLMVRKKQTIYPVCFLNAAGRSLMSEHRDPRALSVVNGIAFAVWAGLDGMVLLCDLIFEEPGIVQVIHSAGLKVYCYGNCTADPDSCEQLIQWGVDGIIADRVGYIARALYPRFLTDGTANSTGST